MIYLWYAIQLFAMAMTTKENGGLFLMKNCMKRWVNFRRIRTLNLVEALKTLEYFGGSP